MGLWSPSPEEGKVKRLSRDGVGYKPSNRNGLLLTGNAEDEEIVCSHVKT